MKKSLLTASLAFLFLALVLFGCRKSVTSYTPQIPAPNVSDTTHPIPGPTPISNQMVPYPQYPITGCSYSPDYGDTLIYPQPTTSQDYIVVPINNPGTGRYFSWPEGMVIDSATGAINVTKSETGERYAIGFVKQGTTDTCVQTLIIAGASYMDSVYVLANNATKALPYFNANPNLVTASSGSQFDVTKEAYGKKISFNGGSGILDLQKTLNGGAFGPVPYNGETIETGMYYRLNDGSNNALQHITVQLMYYNSRSQIGAALLNNVLLRLNNILTSNLITTKPNPRPPLIIVTRFN